MTVARTEGNLVGLSAGLQAGENVVVDGADKLQDGTKVAASTERTAAAAEPDGTSSTGTAAAAPTAASSNTATSGTATTPGSSPGKGHQRKPRTAAGDPASHPGR